MKQLKTIKIYPKVHTELKTFVAMNQEYDMATFASQAILKLLKDNGHKFIYPKQRNEK